MSDYQRLRDTLAYIVDRIDSIALYVGNSEGFVLAEMKDKAIEALERTALSNVFKNEDGN